MPEKQLQEEISINFHSNFSIGIDDIIENIKNSIPKINGRILKIELLKNGTNIIKNVQNAEQVTNTIFTKLEKISKSDEPIEKIIYETEILYNFLISIEQNIDNHNITNLIINKTLNFENKLEFTIQDKIISDYFYTYFSKEALTEYISDYSHENNIYLLVNNLNYTIAHYYQNNEYLNISKINFAEVFNKFSFLIKETIYSTKEMNRELYNNITKSFINNINLVYSNKELIPDQSYIESLPCIMNDYFDFFNQFPGLTQFPGNDTITSQCLPINNTTENSSNNVGYNAGLGIIHGIMSALTKAILDIRAHQGKKESITSRLLIHGLGAAAGTALTSAINHSLTETNDEDKNQYNQLLLNIGASFFVHFGLQGFNYFCNEFLKNKPLLKATTQNAPISALIFFNGINLSNLVCMSSSFITGTLLSRLISYKYPSLASTENITTDNPITIEGLIQLHEKKINASSNKTSCFNGISGFFRNPFSSDHRAPDPEKGETSMALRTFSQSSNSSS